MWEYIYLTWNDSSSADTQVSQQTGGVRHEIRPIRMRHL